MEFLQKHPLSSAFVLGAISALSFAPLYWLFCFVIAFVLMWQILSKIQSYKKTALTGYLFGFGHFMAGFYWISNALLIDIPTFGWLYPITLFGLGAVFGTFFIIPFLIGRFFQNRGLWVQLLAFSAGFVLMEYVRAYIFTGFPWNMAGTVFAFSDTFIQSASVIGTYGLSFVFCLISASFYAILKKQYKSGLFVLTALIALILIFGEFRLRAIPQNDSEIKVRLVQPSIDQSLKWDEDALENNLQTYIDMSAQEPLDQIKFVVWGETATAFDLEHSLYFQNLIRRAIPQNGYLMTGMLRFDPLEQKIYNAMGVFDDTAQMVAFYDKNHLVPFGEYIPFRRYLPSFLRPVTNLITDISTTQKYKQLNLEGLPPFSALICYEIIFPDQILDRQNKPSFIVLVSNDGWYGDSFGPYQHLSSAKMRAVEEGITIIRSANNGISAVIDPMGHIIAKIPLNQKGIQDVYLPSLLSVPTFYASYNFSFYFLCALICFLVILFIWSVVYKR